MAKTYLFILLFGVSISLSGCGIKMAELGGEGLVSAWGSKPDAPPPADLESQIPQHEDWCYVSLGDSMCFSHPQDVAPSRLINVDPQNRYPVTPREYHEVLAEDQ